MTRTKGFRVKIWEQGAGETTETASEHAEYIAEDGEATIFATQRAAKDAADAYVKERPNVTYALEPVVL